MITNILIGLLMVGITVIVQAIGTSFWIRFLIHEIYEQERKVYKTRFAGLLIITSIFLTILNTVEAFIWALLYYYLPNITEIETLESAIYFSLVTFTTLGYGDLTIGTDYRFLTGIEALNGILLIGWSSAVMFATVHAIWKQNWGIMNKKIAEAMENDKEDMSKKQDLNEKSNIKVITRVVLVITASFFVWYVLSDRHTPYTDQAQIKGLITPVTPKVSGYVKKINVNLHSIIKAGDTLFELDKRPFQIAIAKAEADLDYSTQSVAATTASVKASAGKLGVAKAQLDRAERNWNRVQKVMKENKGALSEADKDQSETGYYQAVEQVASAQAALERDQQRLGVSGPDNPKIRAAIQNLEKAQLDKAYSTIMAPTDGVIESFDIDIGYFASSGQPLTTLISDTNIWIQANMKENNLSLMKIGNEVELLFDIAPGKVFKGQVRSMGFGIATDDVTNKGGLPSITNETGWLGDPRRFPVVIGFEIVPEIRDMIRLGGQVDVVVYSSNNFLLNGIASFRIRLNSILSYVR